MLRTIEGVYREGKVELAERPNDVGEEVPVLVTFLESHRVDLRAHGIDEAHAAELRARLSTFAADWDGTEMDVYDDYDRTPYAEPGRCLPVRRRRAGIARRWGVAGRRRSVSWDGDLPYCDDEAP